MNNKPKKSPILICPFCYKPLIPELKYGDYRNKYFSCDCATHPKEEDISWCLDNLDNVWYLWKVNKGWVRYEDKHPESESKTFVFR